VANTIAWGIVASIGVFAYRLANGSDDEPGLPVAAATTASPARDSAYAEMVESPEHQARNLLATLEKTGILSDAIRLLRPHMGDTVGVDPHPIAAAMGLWARSNMRWGELERMYDSRRVEVEKDPDRFRGEKLCVRGEIVEIYADRSVDPIVHVGGMAAGDGFVRFIAVRSTRGLVAGSSARFCGIFTGMQTYTNTLGGMTSAPFVVGMFDLEQNRY